MMEWTVDQKKAIDSRDGTILVSAAAGSGKTAVLVERIIQRLIDSNKPCDADRLLIVTFTKAATQQMKEKIEAAVAKRLAENPGDKRLLRQQMLLPFAHICTIDSFCGELVRENFHILGIDPDFKMLDNSELTLIRNEAITEVIEMLYQENSKEFIELVELLHTGKDDSVLINSVLELYDFSIAYPFPYDWLDKLEHNFCSFSKQDYRIKLILDYVKNALTYCRDMAKDTHDYIKKDEIVFNAYSNAFAADIQMFDSWLQTVEAQDWDSIRSSLEKPSYVSFSGTPSGYESSYKSLAQKRRGKYKDIIKKITEKLMCSSIAEFEDDLNYLSPLVNKLIQAVKMFSNEFSLLKSKANGFDFSDITHLALDLLVEKNSEGSILKTELAKELSERFEEILVDEYQDINETQDMLFSAISRDESNIFMVGDVKQSIYRFRQAMPEIFLRRRDSMPLFNGNDYPASIYLDRNFRSRKGIIDTVNYIFSQLMSRAMGEVDYSSGERLVAGAKYPENNQADTEIHILEYDKGSGNDKMSEQADYVARLIRKMIDDGFMINEANKQRPAEFRDFCILLRSAKDKAQCFAQALIEQNIPVYCNNKSGFFNVPEIYFVISLLRVLDNPLQDVPLISVMFSPIYGFSPDELAQLRINEPSCSIYHCLLAAQKRGDKKCSDFLGELERLRMYCSACSSSNLVQKLLEESGYLAIVGAMPNGEQRRSNLRLLEDYAEKYSISDNNSISGFIRFIDKISEKCDDVEQANQISDSANVVRIMSMHGSKGLEFPVCILASCQNNFNLQDMKRKLIIHPAAGIGLHRKDINALIEFDTLSHCAARLALEKSQKSEELRVMYVAMTRAKERLICVMSFDNACKHLNSLCANISTNTALNSFSVYQCNSFADWIISAALRHPDSHKLRELAGIDSSFIINANFKLKTVINSSNGYEEDEIPQLQEYKVNNELLKNVEERLSFKYKYAALGEVTAKRAASHLKDDYINREFFASSRPAFLSNEGLTPAQKGTATHKFMQFADYSLAKSDSAAECRRLVDKGFLSEQEGQAVSLKKIDAFFTGNLAKRIFNAESVMRERKFTINIPVSELYEDLKSFDNESVLFQGIADCVFVENDQLVIVDYKTDYVSSEEVLIERYKEQLQIYRHALSQCFNLPVNQTLIYSFALEKEIEV